MCLEYGSIPIKRLLTPLIILSYEADPVLNLRLFGSSDVFASAFVFHPHAISFDMRLEYGSIPIKWLSMTC